MRAMFQGRVIAESEDTVVVDGNHYFPRDAVDASVLRDSDHSSVCPWKGAARYHHVEVDGNVARNAVWYYPETKPEAKSIEGRLAFWNGVEVVD